MAKETAEQKLLRLIEATDAKDPAGGKGKGQPHPASPAMQELQLSPTPGAAVKQPAPASSPAASPVPGPVVSASPAEAQRVLNSVKSVGVSAVSISIPPIFDSLIEALKGAGSLAKSPSSFNLKDINRIMAVLVVIFAVLFSMNILSGLRVSKQDLRFDVDQQSAAKGKIVLPSVKDITEYLQTVANRNIFQPYEKKVVETKLEEQQMLAPKVAERISDWKLVGVSWIDTPDSATAMIEDAKTSMTYFVKTGEVFKGVRVESIYADRVVVSFDGEISDIPLY